MICSDHPQAYSVPITFFGRSRLPSKDQAGLSIFDIQARIGQSSPEIHRLFPKHISIRQTIENAWADAFLSKPHLTVERDNTVDACLRWFEKELNPAAAAKADYINRLTPFYSEISPRKVTRASTNEEYYAWLESENDWADKVRFADVSFSAQRVALFLRAIVKAPELLILDEAFSGMDENTRIKCLLFLAYGETMWFRRRKSNVAERGEALGQTLLAKYSDVSFSGLEPRQALISISHRKEEVPFVVSTWLCLPAAAGGEAPRFGEISRIRRGSSNWWEKAWGLITPKPRKAGK